MDANGNDGAGPGTVTVIETNPHPTQRAMTDWLDRVRRGEIRVAEPTEAELIALEDWLERKKRANQR